MSEVSVSIIIVTRNRASDLAGTLDSMDKLICPLNWRVELLLVDNGSVDHTARIVQERSACLLPLRYIYEGGGGKSVGLNRAIAEAAGEILIFTDDDVRVPADWVERMAEYILRGEADAVTGPIGMAPHLRREWMERTHYGQFACNFPEGSSRKDLVGANMAVARRVFEKVPKFDEEIGPGISAGGEDTLFSWQVCEAGFRVMFVADAVVEHHFDPERMTRRSMCVATRRGAISDHYIAYHWLHQDIQHPRYRLARQLLRLWYYRLRRFREWWTHATMPGWEKGMMQEVASTRLYINHHGERRRYAKRGLVKLA